MQGHSNEVVTNELERQDQPKNNQSVLRVNTASVALGPKLSHQVKHEVSNNQTQNRSDNWCSVDGCQIAIAEVVCWDDQHRDGRVVANRPRDCEELAMAFSNDKGADFHTVKEVEQANQEDGQLQRCVAQTTAGLPECVRGVLGPVLFDANNTQEARFALRDTVWHQVPGVEGLVPEHKGQSETEGDDAEI